MLNSTVALKVWFVGFQREPHETENFNVARLRVVQRVSCRCHVGRSGPRVPLMDARSIARYSVPSATPTSRTRLPFYSSLQYLVR
jgi:hypothetical protein